MTKSTWSRYACTGAILVGFFLPWIDLGAMGEFLEAMAGAAGAEFSSTLNGWQLAAGGGDKLAGDWGFVLFATLPVALVIALRSNARERILSSVLGLMIVLLLSPVSADAGSQVGPTGVTAFAIGKLLTLAGFAAAIITGIALPEDS